MSQQEVKMDLRHTTKELQKLHSWVKKQECCGEVDIDGVCMSPACSFGNRIKVVGVAIELMGVLRWLKG